MTPALRSKKLAILVLVPLVYITDRALVALFGAIQVALGFALALEKLVVVARGLANDYHQSRYV